MELEGRLQWDMNRVKVLQEGEMVYSSEAQDGPRHGDKLAKGFRERGQELKVSRYGYNQGKN